MRVFTLWSSVGSHKHSWIVQFRQLSWNSTNCSVTPPHSPNYSTQITRAVPPSASLEEPGIGKSKTLQTLYQQSSSKATGKAEDQLLMRAAHVSSPSRGHSCLLPFCWQRLQLPVLLCSLLSKIPALKLTCISHSPTLQFTKASAGSLAHLLHCL